MGAVMGKAPLVLFVFLALLIPVFGPSPVAAQRGGEGLPSFDVEPAPLSRGEEAELEALFDSGLAGLAEDELAERAWQAIRRGRYVWARELAEELLRRDADSVPGHLFLGLVQHLSEGNLPLALYHVKTSRELIEERDGRAPFDDRLASLHFLAISALADISGSMGRNADKVRYLLEREEIYELHQPADLGWPLMRLRRYDEARAAAAEALASGDPAEMATALTALCAIDAEQQEREASFDACMRAANYERTEIDQRPVPFTNAAESALGVLRFDEAERLILEATNYFVPGTVANPWLDLTRLYLTEGRLSEALDSVRRMFDWRRRQPAFVDEQNRAETELTSAIFLLVAGHPAEASRISGRVLERPDRTGFTSSETEQMEAANALVDSLAQATAAEAARERASWSPWREVPAVRLEEFRLRLKAWSSGRRTAALLSADRILDATLRPYLAGSVEIPEWVKTDLVRHLGPGVVEAALGEARERETVEGAEGYFLALETEIAALRGDEEEVLQKAEAALAELPGSEVLMRARVSARAADAARDLGQSRRALELYDQVMQLDPGIFRRLGASLPVAFTATGERAETVVGHLQGSPRFDAAGKGWFRVEVEAGAEVARACLLGPRGTRFACAEVTPRAGDDDGDLERRLAAKFHQVAFAPRLDLTQADLQSLDGSPTAGGGRASERMRSVLRELVGGGADP